MAFERANGACPFVLNQSPSLLSEDIYPYFLVENFRFERFGNHVIASRLIETLQTIVQGDGSKRNNWNIKGKFSDLTGSCLTTDSWHVDVH